LPSKSPRNAVVGGLLKLLTEKVPHQGKHFLCQSTNNNPSEDASNTAPEFLLNLSDFTSLPAQFENLRTRIAPEFQLSFIINTFQIAPNWCDLKIPMAIAPIQGQGVC
jgi:hypothetical protein